MGKIKSLIPEQPDLPVDFPDPDYDPIPPSMDEKSPETKKEWAEWVNSIPF